MAVGNAYMPSLQLPFICALSLNLCIKLITSMNYEYHFITQWLVLGTVEEVSDIIGDAGLLVRWWPSVYSDVKIIEPGDEYGVGKVVSLYTKGWLPYTLSWNFRVMESREPYGYTIEAWGDFDGRGIWAFEQHGSRIEITYHWRIKVDRPLLHTLSFLLKPIFSVNHRRATARGEESLKLELARRRASSPDEATQIPHTSVPTFPHNTNFTKTHPQVQGESIEHVKH
jgi:hypothetical protein